VSNPFTPTFGVTPPLLVGRDAEISALNRALSAGPGDPARAIVCTGARGTGKTVLLNALEDTARDSGWAVVSVTAHPGLADELTQTVLPPLLAAHGVDEFTSHVTGASASVLGVGASVSRSVTERYPFTPSLRSELTDLATALGLRGKGVFISLDEVHRARRTDLEPLFHAVQHAFREGLPVAFAAAGLPAAVHAILNDDVLTFLRRAQRWTLGDLPEPLVAEALRGPIALAGRTISQAALDLAVETVHGYPFLIQVVGFELWSAQPDSAEISLRQARAAVPRAIDAAHRLVHDPALRDLSPGDRAFLTAMAVDPEGPTTVADIAERLNASRGHVNKYRARLIAAEVIEPSGRGQVDFALPFLRDYLRQTA
jgi:hypothetical protein